MREIGLAPIAILIPLSVVALVNAGAAQPGDGTGTTGTRLITLGTVAGPPPRPYRAQSSNLLIVNGTLYVIDAGDGTTRRIAKAGFNVRDVGTIFITHHHDDHTAGLGTLMSVAWDSQRTTPINVYGPPRTEDLVKSAVQYFTISAESRIADGGRTIPIERLFFGHDVGPGIVYQDGRVRPSATSCGAKTSRPWPPLPTLRGLQAAAPHPTRGDGPLDEPVQLRVMHDLPPPDIVRGGRRVDDGGRQGCRSECVRNRDGGRIIVRTDRTS